METAGYTARPWTPSAGGGSAADSRGAGRPARPGWQAEFGVSLTVMRESLKVLAAKGLVGARQKRGTYVRQRADWNLLDPDVLRWQFSAKSGASLLRSLDEVRAIIEPAAARLAALRRT